MPWLFMLVCPISQCVVLLVTKLRTDGFFSVMHLAFTSWLRPFLSSCSTIPLPSCTRCLCLHCSSHVLVGLITPAIDLIASLLCPPTMTPACGIGFLFASLLIKSPAYCSWVSEYLPSHYASLSSPYTGFAKKCNCENNTKNIGTNKVTFLLALHLF